MEGNTPVMVELDAGDLGGPRLRRGRLGVAFHRYRQSAEESTPAQNAKTPPGTQPDGGVMVSVIVVVSQRDWDVLTPRPHRSADRQGEGVRLLSPRRGPQPSSYGPGTPSFLQ